MSDIHTDISATNIKIGDMVDLEGDTYADPDHDHPWMEDLYAVVDDVIHETSACVAIAFESFDLVGFPTNHLLRKVI